MSTEIVDASYVLDHLGKVPIVDLRPGHVFELSHVPGAENVDYWSHKMQDGFSFSTRLTQLLRDVGVDASEPVIIMCQIGQTSTEACELLEERGFTELRHYAGGFSDWASDGSRPCE